MTAGAGLIHSEMPEKEFLGKEGDYMGFRVGKPLKSRQDDTTRISGDPLGKNTSGKDK